jgi:hypothetical protein
MKSKPTYEEMEAKNICDVAITFEYEEPAYHFKDVDYDDLTYALSTYYGHNFYTLNEFNCVMNKGEEVIINLSQIKYIRVKNRRKDDTVRRDNTRD